MEKVILLTEVDHISGLRVTGKKELLFTFLRSVVTKSWCRGAF